MNDKLVNVRSEHHEFKQPVHRAKAVWRNLGTRPALILVLLALTYYILTKPIGFPQNSSIEPADSVSIFGKASEKLNWRSCGGRDRFECANLSVPLDYLNKDDPRRASIAITRYLASGRQHAPDHGTIIFNPGGPGGSGTDSTYRIGPLLDEILQGQYDILGFDPRGINMTLPKVTCLKSTSARSALEQIITSTAPSLNLHDIGIWDAFAEIVASECSENSGADILPFVNTPTVARDIASIVDALHRERVHHVSYWGFSYGTNLGAIFTAMFPNKLHKIILDGIRSPFDAAEIYKWGYTSLASQNDVMEGYFSICDAVGPSRCALAGSSKQTVMDLLSALYDRPLPVANGRNVGLITFYALKSFLYGTLYRPAAWPIFANITREILHNNGSSFLSATTQGRADFDGSEGGMAVLCTDAVPATNHTLSSWSEYVANMTAQSFVAGDSRSLETMPCRHWRSLPNERFEGSFADVQLEVPVLMLGNTYDPATPLESAKRLAAEMGDGNVRLVEQRSYGHCSISSVSSCTWNTTLGYLLRGELPEVGKVCEVDDGEYGGYFPREGDEEIEASGGNAGILQKLREELSAEIIGL